MLPEENWQLRSVSELLYFNIVSLELHKRVEIKREMCKCKDYASSKPIEKNKGTHADKKHNKEKNKGMHAEKKYKKEKKKTHTFR